MIPILAPVDPEAWDKEILCLSCATYLSWINYVCVQLGVSGLQNRAPGGEQIPEDVLNICSDIENHQLHRMSGWSTFPRWQNATMNQRVCDYSCYCCLGPLIHLAARWIPSSAAAGGGAAPLILRPASYGCRSVAVLRHCCSHLDSFVFGFAIVQERLPGDVKRHGRGGWTPTGYKAGLDCGREHVGLSRRCLGLRRSLLGFTGAMTTKSLLFMLLVLPNESPVWFLLNLPVSQPAGVNRDCFFSPFV